MGARGPSVFDTTRTTRSDVHLRAETASSCETFSRFFSVINCLEGNKNEIKTNRKLYQENMEVKW